MKQFQKTSRKKTTQNMRKKMDFGQNTNQNNALEKLINEAIKKVDGNKENDICRFLPMATGGYIHHFTMRKMKTESPEQLMALIKKHVTETDKPQSVPPKPRAARGSRKRRDQYLFTKTDLERMLNMARLAGDKEMVRKLTPKKDLRTIKRELIISIRHGRFDQDLWQAYGETITHQNSMIANGAAVAV